MIFEAYVINLGWSINALRFSPIFYSRNFVNLTKVFRTFDNNFCIRLKLGVNDHCLFLCPINIQSNYTMYWNIIFFFFYHLVLWDLCQKSNNWCGSFSGLCILYHLSVYSFVQIPNLLDYSNLKRTLNSGSHSFLLFFFFFLFKFDFGYFRSFEFTY